MTVVNKTVKHCEENGAMKKSRAVFRSPIPWPIFWNQDISIAKTRTGTSLVFCTERLRANSATEIFLNILEACQCYYYPLLKNQLFLVSCIYIFTVKEKTFECGSLTRSTNSSIALLRYALSCHCGTPIAILGHNVVDNGRVVSNIAPYLYSAGHFPPWNRYWPGIIGLPLKRIASDTAFRSQQ